MAVQVGDVLDNRGPLPRVPSVDADHALCHDVVGLFEDRLPPAREVLYNRRCEEGSGACVLERI